MQVLGKLLVGEIFGMQLMCCRLKGQDAMTKFMIVLNSAMDGQDTDRFPFSFYDRQGKYVDSLLTANKRTDAEGSITGVFCFLHTTSVELLQVRLGRLSLKMFWKAAILVLLYKWDANSSLWSNFFFLSILYLFITPISIVVGCMWQIVKLSLVEFK